MKNYHLNLKRIGLNKKTICILAILLVSSFTDLFPQYNVQSGLNFSDLQTFSPFSFNSQWGKAPEAIKSRNSYKRLEWFYSPRLNEYGVFPKEFIDMQKKAEMLKMPSVSNKSLGQWTNIGPLGIDFSADGMVHQWGVVSGRVKGLAVDPTNPDIVYAGAAGGGIWKTTDGGQSWVDKSGGLNLLTFGSIAIDPANPNIIYAGTGEYVWLLEERFYSGDGMYKSTDGGDSWAKINTGFGIVTHFTDVEVSPLHPNILMASIAKNFQNTTPNEGIWRSTNAGLNWTRVLNIEGAWDVAFHPTNANIVYAAIGNNQPAGGFLVSTDGGITFNQSNMGLPAPDHIGRIQFDISQSNPLNLYAYIYDAIPISGGMNSCVYRSTNGGASWYQISQGINLSEVGDQGFWDLCIAVNPADSDNIFIGNVEMSKSVNGSTFSYIRDSSASGGGSNAFDSYTHLDHQIIRFAPSNPSTIYVGCDGGVFKSTNGGLTFNSVNAGINSIQLYRVASHNTNPDVLYTGAQDNGFISTNNRGVTPYKLELLGDGTECFMDYSDSNYIFFGTIGGYFGRSSNGGLAWDLLVDPVTLDDSSAFTCPYWQHPVNPDIIYGCLKQKLYKSNDKGNTWAYTTSAPIVSNAIYTAAQSPVNTNNIMVASKQGTINLVRSSDGGYTWSDITNNFGSLSGGYLMRLYADPVNGNTFYLLKNNYTGSLVLKTTDFGTTWTDLTSDLPYIPVNDIFIDTLNSGAIYLANDFGVYLSTNSGANWQRLSNGMPYVPVMDFSYFNHNGTRLLRAATYGRGVFELDLNQPNSVTDPIGGIQPKSKLYQNYPNPFNQETKISYELSRQQFVTLKIFNVLGKEVRTIVNELKTPGKYTVAFNGSDLPVGVYFCRLQSGEFTDIKRMMLVK